MILFLSSQYPGKKQFNLDDYPEVPAHVRVILWLGLEKHQEAWSNRQETEGDFCVFAETVWPVVWSSQAITSGMDTIHACGNTNKTLEF